VPGTQIFTYKNTANDHVRGTPVAPTRQLYVEGTRVLGVDPSLSFHEGENRGVRTRIARATQQAEDVNFDAKYVDGVGYDDLVFPFSQLAGGKTGVGGAADKTWTFTPSMTAANAPEAYSIDVGDDIQNWRLQYGMLKSFTIGAALDELTSLAFSGFAQRAVKGAKATPGTNVAVKIPGDIWTVKFAGTAAGLPGASIQTNFLVDWELAVQTGLRWRHYMDGNLYGGQHVETDIAAQLTMTVESTALAVSEFYDKWLAQTLDFIRLKATGPALGGTNYSAQIDLPVLYSLVKPIDKEDEGINLYTVQANLAFDPTSNASIAPVIVNSLAALP
jgi:hypothetical protein